VTLPSRVASDRQSIVRVRAAVSAAALAGTMRDYQQVVSTRATIEGISLEGLPNSLRAKVLMALAMSNYHARENQNGLPEARAAAQILRECGATDSTHVQVQTGLGAIACSNGAVIEAIEPLEIAFGAASRLDNGPLMLGA